MSRPLMVLLALALAAPLGAQGTPTAADSALRRALELPRIMQRARTAGIPDSSVRGILSEMRRRGVPASEAEPALELEVDAVEAGGRPDNFGAFVRSQVEAGVRGRELAERIRAERQARGLGPAGRGGRPEGAGPPAGRGGRPEGAGPPGARGSAPDSSKGPGARPTTQGGRPAGAGRPGGDSSTTAGKAPTKGPRRP